jgi:predicted amidophosphoribosyltransferase
MANLIFLKSQEKFEGGYMELKKCPYCGKTVLEIAKVCKYCKRLLEQLVERKVVPKKEDVKPTVCRNCGAVVDVSLSICNECGTTIEKEQPISPQTQPVSVVRRQSQPEKSKVGMIVLIAVLAVVALSVFGGL